MCKIFIVIKSDYHQQKGNQQKGKILEVISRRKRYTPDARRHQSSSKFFIPPLHSVLLIFNWGHLLYSCSRHKVLSYILSEYMKYQILSSRQNASEYIYFNNNFCASWWNKTSGFKFVLVFTALVKGAVIFTFKMQIIYHLDSQLEPHECWHFSQL